MSESTVALNVRMKSTLKNAAMRAAKKDDISMTKWVSRAIVDRLLKEAK